MANTLREKDYKQNLIKGANSTSFEFAKEMRKEPTRVEHILWERLRNNKLGFKFRRQQPIENFIPDFYCHKKRLAIELDGSVHYEFERMIYDKIRTEKLKEIEIRVLRFPNSLVENKTDYVVEIISKKLKEL